MKYRSDKLFSLADSKEPNFFFNKPSSELSDSFYNSIIYEKMNRIQIEKQVYKKDLRIIELVLHQFLNHLFASMRYSIIQ